jgi:hypothetical protein
VVGAAALAAALGGLGLAGAAQAADTPSAPAPVLVPVDGAPEPSEVIPGSATPVDGPITIIGDSGVTGDK